METQPNLLLEGPRGRRLCLELAMELDSDVRSAVFHLGYELDPGKGTSTVLFALSSGGSEASAPSEEPSVGDLAAALRSIDASSITEEQLAAALQRAVGTARYWQEPDGEDVLASLPAITAALQPIAGQILTTHTGQAWSQEHQAEQWAVDWRSAEDPAPLPRNPQEVLNKWAEGVRSEEAQAALDRPESVYANITGTWWSCPLGIIRTVGAIPAALNLVEDSFGEQEATVIPVYGAGRTLEIHTAEDWISLCRAYPVEVTASRRHDWFHTTGRNGQWVIPDWQRVASEWDAVHLTTMGYLNTAGRALEVHADTATVLAGWDPDSTLWLADVVREAEVPRQIWSREPNGDVWTRTG
ncbi:hypothetical protein [Arthrobacter caoxuetaonis]|uniref:hypothetical protein n=1 Tax=Arthrobacter caoxuetaonis TaxID=2886935 RepID=UPI001D134E9D|nr:hypothetical protein [Arthrobacter caoxuetaonis]MCC3283808.1 hypothetical protein [Arthrobacter caoxuetaonis]